MAQLKLLNLPIGNAQDVTLRVLKELEDSKVLFCEDTRTLKAFLNHHGVDYSDKVIDSYHDQSAEDKVSKIINRLKKGQNVCYLSEAGSPIISDPAYPLVSACIKEGIEIDSYSGISSVIMALELSGLPSIPFTFHGFAPRDTSKRIKCFSDLKQFPGTHVFFESPHRLNDSLKVLCNLFPENSIVALKELSKPYQKVYRFLGNQFENQKIDYRGEFLFMIYILKKEKEVSNEISTLAQKVLDKKGKTKELSKLLSKVLDQEQQEIYKQLTR